MVPSVLILTPVKNAAAFLDDYFAGIYRLDYPRERLSLGLLEGDSDDGTYDAIAARLPELERDFHRAGLWNKNFGFKIPNGLPRYAEEIQVERRTNLAKSRNHLLFRALDDEEWVLWIDVDVIDYPADILSTLLATDLEIVHPNCVTDYGGESFDRNAWRDDGRLHMHDLRGEGDLVPLDSVGGTMLLVRADRHRDGLIFPPFPYGVENPLIRTGNCWRGEIETEGLGIMAADMGIQCWGMPGVEILHRRE
jgi:glycosyltransferase involved in cell wall biosynthesis